MQYIYQKTCHVATIERLIQPLLHTHSICDATLTAGLSVGYSFGARAGEYTCTNFTRRLWDKMLQAFILVFRQLQWNYDTNF